MKLNELSSGALRELIESAFREIDTRHKAGENFVVPLADGRTLYWVHRGCDEGACPGCLWDPESGNM